MRLGFHLSIGRGLMGAVREGLALGCEAAQIFSRNPRGWAPKPLDPDEAAEFDAARREAGLTPLALHLPYLPNPAAPEGDLRRKSIAALAEELTRADLLKAEYVVLHPGRIKPGRSVDEGLEAAAQGIIEAFSMVGAGRTRMLLETTSGMKGELGARFEELARVIDLVESQSPDAPKLGVCLDTAHVWGAGYNLAGEAGLEETLADFERVLGLDRLALVHLNDSKAELGARLDRHAAPGLGRIGSRRLARLVRHSAFASLAGVMESPRRSPEEDRRDLDRVKKWRRNRPKKAKKKAAGQ